MEETELKKRMILSSIPMRLLNCSNLPEEYASGTIVEYLGRNFFLTVTHVVEDLGNWAFEYRLASNHNGMILQPVGRMSFLICGGSPLTEIDFAYIEIDPELQPYYPIFDGNYNIIGEIPRIINNIDQDIKISKDKKYGFASITCHELAGSRLQCNQLIVFPLEYLTEEDDYLVFTFQPRDKEEFFYKAASGAAILDSEGNVVALVSGGKLEENLVYGVSLEKYKSLLVS